MKSPADSHVAGVQTTEQLASPADLANSTPPAAVEPGAINDQGQIVLHATESTTAQVTLDSPTSASGPAATEASNAELPNIELPNPEVPALAASTVAAPFSSRTPPPPPGANITTEEERHQKLAEGWPAPQAVIFVSGQQHGYIEPCGCTGLENQKGGLIRRDTLLTEFRARGWNLIPLDVGNQVRRIGRQPELKFKSTVEAFRKMGYAGVALGADDWKLSTIELVQYAGSDQLNKSPFLSANVLVWSDASLFPSHRIVESGGRRVGITAVLGKGHRSELQSADIEFADPVEKLKPVISELQAAKCDYTVLLAHASLEESSEIARQVPGFDLVVTAGGFGEPTLNLEKIDGSKSLMVQVGTKGMYGGIIGLFDDPVQPVRYQRLAISSQFKDSERMLAMFAEYQQALADAGFENLGATAVAHPSGRTYVGSEACGDCHTTAYEIWQGTPHSHATTSIIEPNNDRGGIPRHHDPECVSCHATGWHPQQYYPYKTGFESPDATPQLMGSGCENCHGPGSEHVAAELGDIDVTSERLRELQQQMVLPLAEARDRCLECHDLDNSPDFHADGAFDKYWERVKHYGKN